MRCHLHGRLKWSPTSTVTQGTEDTEDTQARGWPPGGALASSPACTS